MAAKLALLAVGAYLVGSLPVAYWVAKLSRGIDLRQYGSGSVGATNLFRVTSWRVAIPVGAFDLAKGTVMVWAAQLVGLDTLAQVAVGLAAIMGHNWPVFLRFHGGRGVLTTLGVAFILPIINGQLPWEILAFLVIAGIGRFGFRQVPVSIVTGIASMPVVSWGLGEPFPLTLGFLAMLLLVIIKRLAVPRAAIAASLSRRELLINRLILDRDIKDREGWVHRTTHESGSPEEPASQKKG